MTNESEDKFKKKFSISLKLFILIFLSLFAMVGIIINTSNYIVQKVSTQNEIHNIELIAEGKTQQVGEWLGGTNSMLKAYVQEDGKG